MKQKILLKSNRTLLLIFIILVQLNLFSQASKSQNLTDEIHRVSTIIYSYKGNKKIKQGTGFYYDKYVSDIDTFSRPGWRAIEAGYLITNKHLLYIENKPEDKQLVDSLVLHLIRVTSIGNLIWEPITLGQDFLLKMTKIHKNSNVDIIAIQIGELLINKLLEGQKQGKKYLFPSGVNNFLLPGKDTLNNSETTDDVIIIGYPEGFYDEVNIFPIVKRGTIASLYGANFNGQPYFLIDAKLFPGSSGSLIISKPRDYLIKEGKMYTSNKKHYIFLGIYSGEPFRIINEKNNWNKESYGLGMVWYSNLIDEISKDGISLSLPINN